MVTIPVQKIKIAEIYANKTRDNAFTTFRAQDALYRVGEIYDVVILIAGGLEKNAGPHRIVEIEFKRIMDVCASEIISDLGRRNSLPDPRGFFLNVMKKLYGDRLWWDGVHSVIQKLYLEKTDMGGRGHEQKTINGF